MRLGVLLAGRRPDDIAKRFQDAREAGFSLCQLNLLQTGLTRADFAQIADAMEEYGVRPVSIGCYVNPMRPDDATFMGATRADLDMVLHCLDILGARRVVFCSGTMADTPYDPAPENATSDALDTLGDFVQDVVRATRARHYTLVIEPWAAHALYSEDRVIQFHESLEPAVAEHVRYVLDAVNFITPDAYPERDKVARRVCRSIGAAAGVVTLRDCVMPPDGEPSLPGPGQGKLDYEAYAAAILQYSHPEAPAIVRNVPASEYAATRDYLLRLSDRWQLG